MIIEENKLANNIGCHLYTLKKYLCRSEFSHIDRAKTAPKIYVLKNITENDVQRLKDLLNR